MPRIAIRTVLLTIAAALLPLHGAQAQDRRQNQPGQFDFYVLALSWSPSFCESASERGPSRSSEIQCGTRPYSFVVHGLWPQYESGFPEFCTRGGARPDRNLISAMLDLMPSPSLIFHEWDRHGTCSGVPYRSYFETIRKARAAVRIPEPFLDLAQPLSVKPADVEEAFISANPGLSRNGIAVACNGRRLSEVRICMSKDLGFRDCGEIDRRSCRAEAVTMPPVRGANASASTPIPR